MSADPPRFETLDSLALARGRQFSAHTATTIERMRLRLRRKEQGLPSVAWAKGAKFFSRTYADGWARVIDPVLIPKARGGTTLVVQCTYNATDEWRLQVVTRARPFSFAGSDGSGVGLELIGSSGPGDDATGLIEVPLLAGVDEEVTVYGRVVVAGSQDLELYGMGLTVLRQKDWAL
jgi:hypothetical protein